MQTLHLAIMGGLVSNLSGYLVNHCLDLCLLMLNEDIVGLIVLIFVALDNAIEVGAEVLNLSVEVCLVALDLLPQFY